MPLWPPSSKGPRFGTQYDLSTPVADDFHVEDDLREFGVNMINCMLTKGYCVVELPWDANKTIQVSHEIAKLDEEGSFLTPECEVVEGMLGEEGSTRVAYLHDLGRDRAQGDEESILLGVDTHLDTIANAISPLAMEAFGFEMNSRTPGLLHESGTPREIFPLISQAGAMQWFKIFTSHRIMCLVFLGPETGSLELQPLDKDSNFYEIETEPGMCVYLRADLLSHKFRAPEESYTLSCWFLQSLRTQRHLSRPCFPLSPVARVLDELLNQPADEDFPGEKIPRDTQRLLRHRQRTGGKTAVRGVSCKMPATEYGPLYGLLFGPLREGFDSATLIPANKWDLTDYYDPDPDPASIKFGKVPCRHSGEVEGLDLFDNKKFRISEIETWTLAPEQRQTLEVGYEAMYYAGFKKKDMDKTATGVYVGATWNEWNFIRPIDSVDQGRFGATSNMNAIPANRLSYLLGFNGASMSFDTEGASSLVAVCKGSDDICIAKERRTLDQSLCVGVSLLLSPKVLLDYWTSGHLSKIGRCLTFDASADGHVIGDACGAVLVAPLSEVLERQAYDDESHPVRGLLCACRTGSAGRAASLTAPSAPTDQRLLRKAVETGGFSVLDVDAVECHGAGHKRGDAVEVASLTKVLRGSKDLEETLLLSAMKTSMTDSRAAAGICGLIKTLSAESIGALPPSVHLEVKNKYMDIDSHPISFTTETSEFWTSSAYCGVTSKGFGGTVAHVIAWGSVDRALQPPLAERPELNRVDIMFWPGGGGELEDDAHPDRAYTITGSWSAWLEVEDMEEEEPGVHGYTVTLGEHCVEQFQIHLDGDPQRVLHPSIPQAPANSPVQGPSVSAGDLCWTIDGRVHSAEKETPQSDLPKGDSREPHGKGKGESKASVTEVNGNGTNGINGNNHANGNGHDYGHEQHHGRAEGKSTGTQGQYAEGMQQYGEDYGGPGDQYRVRLCINGKWRTVTWEKLEKDVSAPAAAPASVPPLLVTARYFVTASWNSWQLDQEMDPHPIINGLFHTDVLLKRTGGEFQIVVNRDVDQVLYPSADGTAGSLAHPVCGPDAASPTRGMNWFLDGKPGDFFRIEYQMARDNGAIRKAVSFRRIGYKALSGEQLLNARTMRYFIVGSWNRWRSQEMTWNREGGYFQFQIAMGVEGREMFQILMDNDWRLVLRPEREYSEASEVIGPSDSSQCDGINWMVGGQDETIRTGSRYIIRLHISDEMPVRTDWVRWS